MQGSPFPGMDPFIEANGLWGDFHDTLLLQVKQSLDKQLPSRYVARVKERTFIDTVDPSEVGADSGFRFEPDVSVKDAGVVSGASAGKTATEAVMENDANAVVMHAVAEVQHREIYIDIYQLEAQRRLVTSIELLSPTNKRRGSVGWDQYERKREVFLRGFANLVEIDLLRRGNRHQMREPWPNSPYYALVLRRDSAPQCHVWPGYVVRPLPTIPIPLVPPDKDVVLRLQPIVDEVYRVSRYASDISYELAIEPSLLPEEQAFLASLKS